MTVLVHEVAPGVLRLHCHSWRGSAAGYDVSAYVVRGVLVDTGFPRVERDVLDALAPLAIRGVLVTHQHEDHAGNAEALAARGLPLVMHPACEAVLRTTPPIGLYRSVVWGAPRRLTAPLVPFDAGPLEIVPLPGHTPDHLGLWDPGQRVLASGDLFLGVKVRVAHHDESPAQLVGSLRAAAALEPRLLLDAHRGPLHDPVPLLRAKADWIEATTGEVRALAAAGIGEREITRRLLGREAFVGRVSFGEYSRRSLVRAMMRED
ncbi:MAG: hypothetical protein JWL60_1390 [Gemmatimonadetes bacterium]|jgi:ribonuclease/clavin/mitogillin|nr:hypothetical protein [Gemmatimonadota bacterium]